MCQYCPCFSVQNITCASASSTLHRMSYTASISDCADKEGKVVGSGHCTAFVQDVAGAPPTGDWSCGTKVKGSKTIVAGTAIATFTGPGETYVNESGKGHAAIYVSQDATGITVWDQWKGQPVHKRVLRFASPGNSNNGDLFHAID